MSISPYNLSSLIQYDQVRLDTVLQAELKLLFQFRDDLDLPVEFVDNVLAGAFRPCLAESDFLLMQTLASKQGVELSKVPQDFVSNLPQNLQGRRSVFCLMLLTSQYTNMFHNLPIAHVGERYRVGTQSHARAGVFINVVDTLNTETNTEFWWAASDILVPDYIQAAGQLVNASLAIKEVVEPNSEWGYTGIGIKVWQAIHHGISHLVRSYVQEDKIAPDAAGLKFVTTELLCGQVRRDISCLIEYIPATRGVCEEQQFINCANFIAAEWLKVGMATNTVDVRGLIMNSFRLLAALGFEPEAIDSIAAAKLS